MIEINEGVIGGIVVENREDNVGLADTDQAMDNVPGPAEDDEAGREEGDEF